jgi:hypothetical protein
MRAQVELDKIELHFADAVVAIAAAYISAWDTSFAGICTYVAQSMDTGIATAPLDIATVKSKLEARQCMPT